MIQTTTNGVSCRNSSQLGSLRRLHLFWMKMRFPVRKCGRKYNIEGMMRPALRGYLFSEQKHQIHSLENSINISSLPPLRSLLGHCDTMYMYVVGGNRGFPFHERN